MTDSEKQAADALLGLFRQGLSAWQTAHAMQAAGHRHTIDDLSGPWTPHLVKRHLMEWHSIDFDFVRRRRREGRKRMIPMDSIGAGALDAMQAGFVCTDRGRTNAGASDPKIMRITDD